MFRRILIVILLLMLAGSLQGLTLGQAATATPQPPTATPEAATTSADTTGTPEATATPEPCFVSTASARTATVRVGPGTNRTALLFLKPDTLYTVIGVNVLEDESVWFKLVKEEVDPGSGAAELWVAAENVEWQGDCLAVAASAAPPIIPILNSAAAANAQVNPNVTGGAWRISFADKFIYSCLTEFFKTTTREAQTLEIMDKLEWDVNLAFASNKRSFTMTGEFVDYSVDEGAAIDFVLTGDNQFTAAATQPDGRNFIYNATLVNADLISGETRFHFGNPNVQCSETVRFEIRRG